MNANLKSLPCWLCSVLVALAMPAASESLMAQDNWHASGATRSKPYNPVRAAESSSGQSERQWNSNERPGTARNTESPRDRDVKRADYGERPSSNDRRPYDDRAEYRQPTGRPDRSSYGQRINYSEPTLAPPRNAPVEPAQTAARPVYSKPSHSSPQMGYRASPVRQIQSPPWQSHPNSRMSPTSMRMQPQPAPQGPTVFPFSEDQAEMVYPGQRMPDGRMPGGGIPMPSESYSVDGGELPQDGNYEENWDQGDWIEGSFCNRGWRRGICEGPDPLACERFGACSPLSFLNELSSSAGVQGFKSPLDFGRNGNFGFNTTLNVADSFWHSVGWGYQFGTRYAGSNFSGDQVAGVNTNSRRQTFVTTGLFHRAFYGCGWQYGVVVDYLNEQYYIRADLFQIRSEISHVWANGHEIGFTGIAGSQDKQVVFLGQRTVRVTDQYRLFYRINFENGSYGRFWGGGTNTSQALVGADYRLPIHNRFDITGNWNYLAPTQRNVGGGITEGWNLGMNLVFYPGRRRCGVHNGVYRALFDVADNGSFSTRLTTP